jgi:capsular exopolysaccharide synthesis family protein
MPQLPSPSRPRVAHPPAPRPAPLDPPIPADPPSAGAPDSGERLLNLLYRGRWFLFFSFVLTLTGTALYSYFQIPIYRAEGLVLVDHRLAPDLKDALDPAPAQHSPGRSIDTELYVLQRSLDVATPVAERLLALRRHPDTGRPLALVADSASPALLAYTIQYRVSLFREPVDGIVRVSAISMDPDEASLLANLYAEELVDRALWRSRARLSATRSFLENETNERLRELRTLEDQMKHFLRRNGRLTMSAEASTLVAQTTELESARTQAELELELKRVSAGLLEQDIAHLQPRLARLLAENTAESIRKTQERLDDVAARLDLIYRQNPGLRGSPAAVDNPTLRLLEQERIGLQDSLVRLSASYIDDAGASLEGEGLAALTQLQRQLNVERQDIAQLEARAALYGRQLDERLGTLQALPAQQIALSQLQRSLQTTERAYLYLREKLEEVRIAEESEQGYAEVIQRAEAPVRPESPDRPRQLILGGLVGILLGLGLAILYDRRSRGIVFAPEDIQSPDYPLLGIVPTMAHEADDRLTYDPLLIAGLPGASVASDAYRKLRFNLLNSLGEAQALAVTSPNPGEGKSLTTLNLAIALAQTGRRIVVVDGDLRRPSLHTKLGIGVRPGFIEMMAERHLQFRRALREQDNLYVLTAGNRTVNTAEILASPDMLVLVNELRRHFDLILFDTPPYLAASDALFIASLCDATILVAAAGRTRDYEVRQGLRDFAMAGQRVLGTVLNAFDPSALVGTRYRYRYYRDSAYYAGTPSSDALLEPAA